MILHITSLRGLAAVGVVVHHLTATNSFLNFDVLINLHFFVDFFFLLSGFVLAYNYENLLKNSKNFIHLIKKRIIRLYPLHLIVLVIFLLIEFTKYNYFSDLEIKKNTIIDLINNIFLLHGFNSVSFNLPSWSISVEIWINFIYLILLFYIKNYKFIIFILLLIALIYLGLYSYNILLLKNLSIAEYINLFRGISGFFLGVFLFINYKFFKKLNYNFLILNLVLFLILFFNSTNYLLYNLIFFLYLNSALRIPKNTNIMKILENKYLLLVGKISYSIYLWHFLIIHTFDQILFSKFGIERYLIYELIVLICSLVVIFCVSKISYEILENKFSIFLKKKIIKSY